MEDRLHSTAYYFTIFYYYVICSLRVSTKCRLSQDLLLYNAMHTYCANKYVNATIEQINKSESQIQ